MNYPLISEYVEAIKAAEDNFDQLKHLRPVLGEDGEPVMTSGNFAVVFKMKDEQTGKLHAVKCFLKEQEGRAEAYRQIAEELEFVSSTFLTPIKYLDKELFVDSANSEDSEFPVLLMDWVEGQTLDKYIREHIDDQYELSLLAYQFSRLAMWLMPQPFAHGDLKPDNILVKEDGTLVLVDYDGMYVPAMKGQKARELGSPDFRHPSRTEEVFDDHIDDFSLASILLSLKAIALQPSLLEEYGASDRLLFSEKDYRNLSESKVMDALKPLMQDAELASLYSLYILALSQNNLSQVSFRLFNLNRPQALALPDISDYCSIRIEDSHGYEVDKYGAIYSHDHKILLRLPCDIIQYNVEEGTEIVATGAFDHFDVVAGGGAVDIFESDLEYLYLPASVKYITASAFLEDGRRIKEIRVANDPNYYKHYLPTWANKIVKAQPYSEIISHSKSVYDISGVEYSQDGKTLISLYWLSPDVTKYEIKEGVKTIKFGAAQLAKNIHEIVLPSGVEYIEGAAFENTSLSSIKLPLTLRPLESDIFYGCDQLETIIIPEGTKVVYEEMLPTCKDMLIEEKDDNDYSTKIDKIDFDNAWIDEFGVMYSSDRKRLLKAPKDIVSYNIKAGTKVICNGFSSKYECGRNVTGAFKDCTSLRLLSIPDSVTKIGNVAFKGCSSLTNLYIPKSVKELGSGAFFNCGIKMLTIPDGITKIEDETFYGCFDLTTLIIPNSVSFIGDDVLGDCDFVETIYVPLGAKGKFETLLPDEFENRIIENNDIVYAWSDSLGVKYSPDKKCLLKAPDEIKEYTTIESTYLIKRKAFKSCFDLESIVITNNVIEIEEGAFSDCDKLTCVKLPNSLLKIGESAFQSCGFSSIELSEGVLEIGDCAFFLSKLVSVFIPQSIKLIHGNPFSFCVYLKKIEVDKNNPYYDSRNNCNAIIETQNNILVSGCQSTTIPDSVRTVGDYAFYFTGLTSVFIPNSVRSIGNYAYSGSKITSLIIPDSVIEIGEESFSNCQDLISVTLSNNIIKIPIRAFSWCHKITSIAIPYGVQKISFGAFENCEEMTSLYLPDSLVEIESRAFWGCRKLSKIIIPPSVDKIAKDSFERCYLYSIIIPSGTRDKFEKLLPEFKYTLVEQKK